LTAAGGGGFGGGGEPGAEGDEAAAVANVLAAAGAAVEDVAAVAGGGGEGWGATLELGGISYCVQFNKLTKSYNIRDQGDFQAWTLKFADVNLNENLTYKNAFPSVTSPYILNLKQVACSIVRGRK
jgi:hypothetical protein